MDIISMITTVLGMISGIPAVGPILAVALKIIAGLSVVITALVAVWHGVVSVLTGLAAIPGLSGLQGLARSLQADTAVVDKDSNQILSWIERFSSIPIPQTQKSSPPPTNSVPQNPAGS